MKKIAVLGGSGAIGQRTVDILKEEYLVKASYYTRPMESVANCSYVKVDISNLDEIKSFLSDCDAVINCAGASYINGEKIAREAENLHIPYIDPSGEAFLENKLNDIKQNDVYVLSSGYYPGMSGLLMRYICESFDVPETINGFCVSEEVPSKSAIEDFVLTNLSGFGVALSYYANGEVKRDSAEQIEIIHNNVYKMRNYLSVEVERIAEEYTLKKANWYNVSFGEEIIKKLQEAVVAIKFGQESYHKIIEEVITLFNKKMENMQQFTYIRAEGQGYQDSRIIKRRIELESECSSVVSAIIAAKAAKTVLEFPMRNGIYYAMDIIDFEEMIKELPNYGVKITLKNTQLNMQDVKYEECSI